MAHEQVVQPPARARHFTQRGPQQVVPQPPLHPHRLARRVPVIQRPQAGNVLVVVRIAEAEVLFDALPVAERNVLTRDERPVPQPLVQAYPAAVPLVQREAKRRCRLDRASAGPAQQPILAVGQNAHARAFAGPLGLSEVVVNLLDVTLGGTEPGPRANPPLDLDERIQRRQVHRPPRCLRWRVLLDDLVRPRQPRTDQEVPHRARDVRFRLGILMPPQNLPRQPLIINHHHHTSVPPHRGGTVDGQCQRLPENPPSPHRPPRHCGATRKLPYHRHPYSGAPRRLPRPPPPFPFPLGRGPGGRSALHPLSTWWRGGQGVGPAQPAPQAVVFPPPRSDMHH